MALFVRDTFTDTSGTALTSHTGETGATWTKHGGFSTSDAVISNANRVRGNGASISSVYYASGTPNSKDYEFTWTWTYKSGATSLTGVFARMNTTGALDGYRVTCTAAGNLVSLVRYSAGVATTLQTYAITWTADQTYALRAIFRDGLQKVWIDNVEALSQADTTFDGTTGSAGLWLSTGAAGVSDTTGGHLDDLVIADITRPRTPPVVASQSVARAATR